jgi:hypothetical protein
MKTLERVISEYKNKSEWNYFRSRLFKYMTDEQIQSISENELSNDDILGIRLAYTVTNTDRCISIYKWNEDNVKNDFKELLSLFYDYVCNNNHKLEYSNYIDMIDIYVRILYDIVEWDKPVGKLK